LFFKFYLRLKFSQKKSKSTIIPDINIAFYYSQETHTAINKDVFGIKENPIFGRADFWLKFCIFF